jgi:peroxin-3
MGESNKSIPVLSSISDVGVVRAFSLRRRFIQNQENVSFTIMALIPTLGEQILDELDVEAVIHELQTKSRSFRTPSEPPPPSESSIASSVELLREQDARSDIESVSASSISGHEDSGMSLDHGESSHSWVDQLSVPPSQPSTSRQPSVTRPETDSVDFLTGAQLSDSITTASSALSYGNGTGLVSTFDIAARARLILSASLLHNVRAPSLL